LEQINKDLRIRIWALSEGPEGIDQKNI